jgi:transglutaminase-like putative cysteine protease
MQRDFRLSRFFRVLAFALAASCLLASRRANAADPWDLAPRPTWVEAGSLPVDDQPEKASRGGVRVVLADHQVRVTDAGVERYVHSARHVVSNAGTEYAAEIRIRFEPSYERLRVHGVRVLRNGSARDVLTRGAVRTFFEENDEDARVYDGRMVALVIVPDVRVGDTVESDYTIEGDNPVFGHKVSGAYTLGSPFDARMVRFRLLAPAKRPFATDLRGFNGLPRVRDLGALREQVWIRENAAGIESEDAVPDGVDTVPWLAFSEHRSWADVATWAATLFPPTKVPETGVLADALAAIRTKSASVEERALAAMHFVQDDVRYLGLELGENSHRPHAPEVVLAQRFGDCKDKAYLLVTLLREIGIDAHVALVHASRGSALPHALPSPQAFNHAIVHASLSGQSVFIDATLSSQGGTFFSHPVPSFGHALCAATGATVLTPVSLPAREGPTRNSHEVYRRTSNGSVTLDVVTTYRDAEADSMRRYLTQVPPTEISTRYLNDYATVHSGIQSVGNLDIHDDRIGNAVQVGEHYVVPKEKVFEWDYDAGSLRDVLRAPRTVLRKFPLEVSHPLFRRHEIEMHLDGQPTDVPEDVTRTTGAFVFRRRARVNDREVRLMFELETRTDVVSVNDVPAHLGLMKTIRGELGGEIGVAKARGAATSNSSEIWGIWAFVVTVGVVVGGVVATNGRTLRRKFRWRRKVARKKSETPATALNVASRAVAERHAAATACSACGERGRELGEPAWARLRYEGGTVTSLRVVCGCGEPRVFYFAIAEE